MKPDLSCSYGQPCSPMDRWSRASSSAKVRT